MNMLAMWENRQETLVSRLEMSASRQVRLVSMQETPVSNQVKQRCNLGTQENNLEMPASKKVIEHSLVKKQSNLDS